MMVGCLVTSVTWAEPAPTTQPTRADISAAIDRGIKFLVKFQNPDGSWGTGTETRGSEIMSMVPGSHDAFRIGTSALCVMALREAGEKPAHDKGLEYLLNSEDARRDDGTLLYNTWAHIYMVHVLALEMRTNKDPRIETVLKRNLKEMADYATYMGGWAYYDFSYGTQAPGGGPTSFGTSAGLVALWEAKQSGIEVPQKLVSQAIHRLEEMRIPNGAYLYSTEFKYYPHTARLPGNLPRGAAGRVQPANYSLWLWKSKVASTENIRGGLDMFVKEHAFLENGRKHLMPHEALYQISGYYYYFDHYYAACLLKALDESEREKYAKFIVENVLPHQEEDGSWWDYPMWDYHKPYGTAFAVMTLMRCNSDPSSSAGKK
jgi:hypothetical protein